MHGHPFFNYSRTQACLFWLLVTINVVGVFIAAYGLYKLGVRFL